LIWIAVFPIFSFALLFIFRYLLQLIDSIFIFLIKTNMEQAEQTMLNNLQKNTGRSMEEWVALVKAQGFSKHGEMMKYLKETHHFTHGYANMVAIRVTGTDARMAQQPDALIEKQYKGKEHFIPLYHQLMERIKSFGNDIEVAPKNAYVSLRRKKQFAILQPATKTQFEIGLNLKGAQESDILKSIQSQNAMCSHKIDVGNENDLTPEVMHWLKAAYDKAG
jgi:predicted transport protein